MGLFAKRRITFGDGSSICDRASKFTDYGDGKVCYKGGLLSKEQCFKDTAIIRDETEGFFDKFDCGSKKDEKND